MKNTPTHTFHILKYTQNKEEGKRKNLRITQMLLLAKQFDIHRLLNHARQMQFKFIHFTMHAG